MFRGLRKRLAKAAVRFAEGDPRLVRQLAYRLMSTRRALVRLRDAGVAVGSVVDVGASDGRWSVETATVWPGARFHMVEANPVHAPALERLCGQRGRFSHVCAAAGDREGSIYFNASDPFGGVASHEKRDGMVALPVTTLARQVERERLEPPYLIKLDTHGFELPILEGAAPLLPDTAVLVIEVYNFTLEDGALRFWEMCAYLAARGFRVIDMAEPGWRPADHAFWQADFVFLRDDAPQFRSNAFRPADAT
jgi:FkbM family methyltransferase